MWSERSAPNAVDEETRSRAACRQRRSSTHICTSGTSVAGYPWLTGVPLLDRTHDLAAFAQACGPVVVEAMVFVQCEADLAAVRRRKQPASQNRSDRSAHQGMVAWAPLEKGRAVEDDLRGFGAPCRSCAASGASSSSSRISASAFGRTSSRASRRSPRSISPSTSASTTAIWPTRFASRPRCQSVPMVLDHIGKPAIAAGGFEPWASGSAAPRRNCRMSIARSRRRHRGRSTGLVEDDLRRYIDHAIDAFGFDTRDGAIWPVSDPGDRLPGWVGAARAALSGVPAADAERFWRGNAARFYRLARRRPPAPRPLIAARGISKSFAGVEVLRDVDLDLRPGEIHALLGENGAGKSTFAKILAGVHRPTRGTLALERRAGRSCPTRSPRKSSASR